MNLLITAIPLKWIEFVLNVYRAFTNATQAEQIYIYMISFVTVPLWDFLADQQAWWHLNIWFGNTSWSLSQWTTYHITSELACRKRERVFINDIRQPDEQW